MLKVLNADMKSPYQSFEYKIGKWYKCKDFDTDKTIDCSNGFYAVDVEGLPYCFNINRKVYECEVKGKSVIIDIFKQRYEEIRLIREVPFDEIKKIAKEKEEELRYKLSEVLFPINPQEIKAEFTDKHKELLKTWASVWASVRDSVRDSAWASARDSVRDSVGASVWASVGASVWASVWDSVGASVWDSVGASVWDSVRASVRDSVGASVRDSVGAYISSLFLNITKWKYINHKEGENPFQSCIDLWKDGFIPSFDGKTWRLHTGQKATVVCEYTPINSAPADKKK